MFLATGVMLLCFVYFFRNKKQTNNENCIIFFFSDTICIYTCIRDFEAEVLKLSLKIKYI